MSRRRLVPYLGACWAIALLWGCDDEPSAPGDTSAPAAVTDLQAGLATATSIRLTWTAPGDDGTSGRASLYDVRQLNGPITEANWALAVPVDAEVGYPKPAGEAETIVVQNLAPGQEYFFAVRASDEAVNWSPVSNVAALSTLDLVPPAAITDLAVQETGEFEVTLAWTAPGDDGTAGRAAVYDVRTSELPITAENWTSAHQASHPPAPAVAGFGETFAVTGLSRFTSYYFAVRAEDDAHNLGAISNVVQATTTFVPQNESELIEKLEVAYARRDYDLYATLFPPAGDPAFSFFLDAPLPEGTASWGRTEELRIHRRVFEPENVQPGETPVPLELWLFGLYIDLAPLGTWGERPDLYRSDSNPEGLDPARWRAAGAEYHATVLWDTQTETDYRVDGRQYFVVIDDLAKAVGDNRKFLIYRWEDLGAFAAPASATRTASWSMMKKLYR